MCVKVYLNRKVGASHRETSHISWYTNLLLCWQRNLWNTYIRPEGAKTVGSMDLGGASTQIAFAVQDQLMGSDYMHVKLYGYPYNVYTHSFLCYGKNEAEKVALDKIIEVQSFSIILNLCVWVCVHLCVYKRNCLSMKFISPGYYHGGGSYLGLLSVLCVL